MPLKIVVDAVEARLASGWPHPEIPVLALNDRKQPPAPGSSHLVVEYPVARGERITFGAPGANIYRETGAFTLKLNLAKGGGLGPALALADELATLFRGRNLGGVRTYAPSSPAIDNRNDAGNFYQLSIAVPYEADVLG